MKYLQEFHAMRDHPKHGWAVLAGMWGAKLTPYMRLRLKQTFSHIFQEKLFFANRNGSIYSDQYLIRDNIW